MTRITILLIGLTFLTSCDCYQRVAGTVVDKETGRPLQGVTVYNKYKNWIKTTTDTTGYYELSSISGGFRCPPMTVIAELKNYNKVEVKIPAGGQETIKMPFDSLNGFIDKWDYFDLSDSVYLKVISHNLASVDCGTLATASLTIGTIENGDTIRVLELCNTKKDFRPNEIVKVIPANKPEFHVTHPRVFIQSIQGQLKPDPFDIDVLKTTYGRLERK